MRRWVVWFGLALLTLTVLSILILTVKGPLLFSPDQVPSSVYHERLVSTTSPLSGSATLLPLMAEVLDGPARIPISLHAEDLAAAQQDLEEYLAQAERLDGVVIELDLSSSDIEEFRRYTQQNLQDMQEMVNLTARFTELERLEITYQDQANPDLLYAVSYEGETIRERALELARAYAGRESAVITASSLFELNTSGQEESVTTLTEIAREIAVMQDERRSRLGEGLLPSSLNLSLAIRPTPVTYGESLVCRGEVIGGSRSGIPITIYLDSIRLTTVNTDENGQYRYLLPIQRIRGGTHLVYTAGDHTYSPIMPFTVQTSPTSLTIAPNPGENDQVEISGVLLAGTIPVSDAPVRITVDALPLTVVETDAQGVYHATVNLSRGNHLIKSQFSSRDFPLNPSEASVVSAPHEPSQGPLLLVLIPLGVLGSCLALAMYYVLHRSRRIPAPTALQSLGNTSEGSGVALSVISPPSTSGEVPGDRARELFADGRVQDAIRYLYRGLAAQLSRERGVPACHTLTPRELNATLGDGLPRPSLGEFIVRYEGLRYGGRTIDERELGTLITLMQQVEHAGGGGRDRPH